MIDSQVCLILVMRQVVFGKQARRPFHLKIMRHGDAVIINRYRNGIDRSHRLRFGLHQQQIRPHFRSCHRKFTLQARSVWNFYSFGQRGNKLQILGFGFQSDIPSAQQAVCQMSQLALGKQFHRSGQFGSQSSQFQLAQISVNPRTDAQGFGGILPDKLFVHASHESHHIRFSDIGHQACGHQAFILEIQNIPIHCSVQLQIRISGLQFQ
ncbi:hypothetical protein IMSAGC004_03191 [Bacteroidaceae bacterium]|nr:hypothetical protein IMSAGC004_03191 [Bacteroidaceae bacterium]